MFQSGLRVNKQIRLFFLFSVCFLPLSALVACLQKGWATSVTMPIRIAP